VTYSYTPVATNLDRVRLWIFDTGPSPMWFFADEELQSFLATEGGPHGAAALACEILAAGARSGRGGRGALRSETGGAGGAVTYDGEDYRALADYHREQAAKTGEVPGGTTAGAVATVFLGGVRPALFVLGMHDFTRMPRYPGDVCARGDRAEETAAATQAAAGGTVVNEPVVPTVPG
jgi:hypothetical protein